MSYEITVHYSFGLYGRWTEIRGDNRAFRTFGRYNSAGISCMVLDYCAPTSDTFQEKNMLRVSHITAAVALCINVTWT